MKCQYCKKIDGKYGKPLGYRKLVCGLLGDFYIQNQLCIDNSTFLSTSFMSENGDLLDIKYRKIRFCPMCGRKLGSENDMQRV